MRIKCISCLLICVLFSMSTMAQELLSLEDRLNTYLFLQQSAPLIEKAKPLLERGAFQNIIGTLPLEKQREINDFVQQAQDDLPQEILISYIYWREIEKDAQKASKVLHYAFMYRLLTLRDLIDHPQNSEPDLARELLKNLTNDPQIESDTIFSRANPLMDHLALTIHEKNHLRLVAQALENTPIIKDQINLKLYRPYIIGPFGFVSGNEIDLYPVSSNESQLVDLISNAQSDLTISSDLLENNSKLKEIILKKLENTAFKVEIMVTSKDSAFWEDFKNKHLLPDSHLHLISQSSLQQPSLTENLLPELFNQFSPPENNARLLIVDAQSATPKLFLAGMTPFKISHSVLIRGPIVTLSKLSLWPNPELLENLQKPLESVSDGVDPVQLRKNGHLRVATHFGVNRKGEVRSTLVDMISYAEKSIYLQTHFLYDSTIVDTLIKRKIQRPELDVRILLDHNLQYGLGGFPNSLFLMELQKYGIEIRAQKKITDQQKTVIIVDQSTALILPEDMTLKAFESSSSYQAVQFFSNDEIKTTTHKFEDQWNSRHQLYELNISDFQLRSNDSMLERSSSMLFNAIGTLLLRSRD